MRTISRSSVTRWVLLLWVGLFFVVVMPGHRRGLIALPGHQPASLASAAAGPDFSPAPYCPLCTLLPKDAKQPVDAPVSCALCFLKANLEAPPAISLPPRFFDTLDYQFAVARSTQCHDVASTSVYAGRGPPTV